MNNSLTMYANKLITGKQKTSIHYCY